MGWLVGGSFHLNFSDPNHQPWRIPSFQPDPQWEDDMEISKFFGGKKLGFKKRNQGNITKKKKANMPGS